MPRDVLVRVEMLVCGSQESSEEEEEEEEEAGVVVRGGRCSMHVQSLSEWAPANIGPYSQAYTVSIAKHVLYIRSKDLAKTNSQASTVSS